MKQDEAIELASGVDEIYASKGKTVVRIDLRRSQTPRRLRPCCSTQRKWFDTLAQLKQPMTDTDDRQ